MNTIQLTARAAIHEGRVKEFNALAAECMQKVREQDSGTIQYDWFFNEDQTECVVRETYKDSKALLAHIANLGAAVGAIFAIADWTIEIFGNPTPELLQAAAALNPKIYFPFQSI
jgi:quinol monooxygenase YgiN